MSGCSINSKFEIVGDSRNIRLLLLKFCIKWYLVFSFFLFVTLNLIGFIFFDTFQSSDSSVEWKTPWFFYHYLLFKSLNFTCNISTGINKVKEMAYFLLIQK